MLTAAAQDNEPILLDDTDEEGEEAGPGPGSSAAGQQLRRSTRSNLYIGPAQKFEVRGWLPPLFR